MQSIDLSGANFCASLTGIRGVAAAKTLTTTAAATYSINGKAYTKQAATGGAAPTTDAATGAAFKPIPPGYGCAFVITLIAGTDVAFSAVQGEIVPLQANSAQYVAGDFVGAPEFPLIPDTHCPIGYQLVRVATDYVPAAGTGYVWGTHNTYETTSDSAAKAFRTSVGAAGAVALSGISCFTLPDRPQVS
jgi:hypothetical protein